MGSRLAAAFQLSTSDGDLRTIIKHVAAKTQIPVFLDRRIDPNWTIPGPDTPADNQVITFDGDDLQTSPPMLKLGPTVADAFDQLADKVGGVWASDGFIVLIGRDDAVVQLATQLVLTRQQLEQSQNVSKFTLDQHPLRWPMLTTPSESLEIVASTWSIKASPNTLPHDLWPAVDTSAIDAVAALGAIGAGFDLAVTVAADGHLQLVPPAPEPLLFTREYPAETLTGAQRQSVGGELRKQPNQWVLRGDAQAHIRLEAVLLKNNRRRRPDAPATSAEPRYSLRLNNVAETALQQLCTAAGWKLQIAESAKTKLQERVQLEAVDEPVSSLIRMVAEKAGVSVEIAADVVTVE